MKYYLERISALAAAAILLQTLYFKFTAAPESIYIFTALGMEPWGRIGVGLLELCIGLLLIFRKTSGWGALLGLGVITGALFAHLFVLGIEVGDDGGVLFLLALLVFILCLITVILQREKLMEGYRGLKRLN